MSGQAESIQILERISNLQGLSGNVAELTKNLNASSTANVTKIKELAVKVKNISIAITGINTQRTEVQGQLKRASDVHQSQMVTLTQAHEAKIKKLNNDHAAELDAAKAQGKQSAADTEAITKDYNDLLEAISKANATYSQSSADLFEQLNTLNASEETLTGELKKLANQVDALSLDLGINDSGTGNDGNSTPGASTQGTPGATTETSAPENASLAANREPRIGKFMGSLNERVLADKINNKGGPSNPSTNTANKKKGGSRKKRKHSSKKRHHITRRKHNSKKKHGGRRSLRKHKKDHKTRRPIKRVTFKHHR